jgi:hypothetical protein
MDTFLKIFGGAALVVIGLVAAVLLFLWWKLRRMLRQIAAGLVPTPTTVDLVLEANPTWTETAKARSDLAALKSCGYTCGPVYSVVGIPGVSVLALHHPATGTHGGYYNHPAVGHFADLCANFADGLELTITNAPQGHQLDTRPNTEKIFLGGQGVAELHTALVQRLAGRAVKEVTLDDFRTDFIAAYGRDMAWRNSKNGVSEAEFMRIAADHGKTLSEEQIKEAFKETKLIDLRRWSAEAQDSFVQTTSLSVAEWKRHEGRMAVLREDFHPHAYVDYLHETFCFDDEFLEKLRAAADTGATARDLLALAATSTGQPPIKLGNVTHPLSLEIHALAEPVEGAS